MTARPEKASRIGELVGAKYRIVRLLAEGGMGVVYEAQHTVVKRRFAVKFLRPDLAERRDILTRFQHEAEAAGALESENVAAAVDFGIVRRRGAVHRDGISRRREPRFAARTTRASAGVARGRSRFTGRSGHSDRARVGDRSSRPQAAKPVRVPATGRDRSPQSSRFRRGQAAGHQRDGRRHPHGDDFGNRRLHVSRAGARRQDRGPVAPTCTPWARSSTSSARGEDPIPANRTTRSSTIFGPIPRCRSSPCSRGCPPGWWRSSGAPSPPIQRRAHRRRRRSPRRSRPSQSARCGRRPRSRTPVRRASRSPRRFAPARARPTPPVSSVAGVTADDHAPAPAPPPPARPRLRALLALGSGAAVVALVALVGVGSRRSTVASRRIG